MSTAQLTQTAGAVLSVHIGQHVRHRDYKGARVTGTVHGLLLDSEGVLTADIVLDAPIVIPPFEEFGETLIHRQHVPAHELSPFDARDELIAEMLGLLRRMEEQFDDNPTVGLSLFIDDIRAAIAKATGGAA